MRIIKCLVGTGLILVSGLALATEVGSVVFDQQGGVKLHEAMLRSRVRLAPGVEFTQETLDSDIKALHSLGNFSDLTGESETMDDGRIKVTFRLKVQPRISRINFSGNDKFPTHELARLLTIEEGQILNDQALLESTRALRKFYEDRGYRDAKVMLPAMSVDPQGNLDITFVIEENLRLKVHDVTFDGAEQFSAWDLRHSIANQYSYFNWVPFLNDYLNFGLFDREELRLDEARLRDKYHEIGYLDFKVDDVQITPLADDPEYVDIAFTVREGEPYTVGKINIVGNTLFPVEELLEKVVLKEGDVFSLSAEQQSSRAIASLYETLGYCDVICRAVRNADFPAKTVDVTFELTEGRKYFVRGVVITGNTDTKTKVILRELAIQEGDPVDRNRIDVSRQRLLGMGYFKKVEAAVVNADALDEKDVQFEVEENDKRYQLHVGVGVSDIDSVFGRAEISTNNFDLFNPGNWFYGGGQRMRLQGMLGVDNAGFNVDFVEPWMFDIPLRFEVSGYMNESEYDNWTEERVGGRTSLQKRIFDDFTSVELAYKFEVVRVTDISHRLDSYMRKNDLNGQFLVSQPSLSITRDTRDSLFNPTEGYQLNLFGSITPEFLGSSDSYYRLEAKGSSYWSFWDKAIIAMVGAKFGTVANFDPDKDVPVFERYLLGGGNSLRGFDYRSVGPVYNGENIGGQTMLLLTAEVSHPIWGPLRGAFFIDAGGVWADPCEVKFNEFNAGAGWGIRMNLPEINVPLRLDIAYPIINNQSNEKSKVRLHFDVGFSF